MVPFSRATGQLIDLLFAESNRGEASRLLREDCGDNLPFLEKLGPVELERFRFAAIKFSGGQLGKLQSAIQLAKRDWRDLLMAAGFGEDLTAHSQWASEVYTANVGSIPPKFHPRL